MLRRTPLQYHCQCREWLCVAGRLLLAAAIVLGVLGLAGAASGDSTYAKRFYVDPGNNATPAIKAGGQVQTWQFSPLGTGSWEIIKGSAASRRSYKHAKTRVLNAYIKDSSNQDCPIPLERQWAPPGDEADAKIEDGSHSTAEAHVNVNKGSGGPARLKISSLSGTTAIVTDDWYRVDLSGKAHAGPPGDKVLTSADSVAAAYIEGDVWTKNPGEKAERYTHLGQNQLVIGRGWTPEEPKQYDSGASGKDPMFVEIYDFTDDTSLFEKLFELDAEAVGIGSGVRMDNLGISLIVDATALTSSASLDAMTTSSWVTNPYSYGASLTWDQMANDWRFDAWGLTPLSDWTVTRTMDSVEATLSYAALGLSEAPFEIFDVQPPDDLFRDGDTYAYRVGGGAGVSDAVWTPEPCAFVLLAFGLPAALVARRRRR